MYSKLQLLLLRLWWINVNCYIVYHWYVVVSVWNILPIFCNFEMFFYFWSHSNNCASFFSCNWQESLFSTVFSITFFHSSLPHNLFSKNGCPDQKTYFEKVDRSGQKPRGRPLSRPRRPFWDPLVAILTFWGSLRRNDWIKKLT